MLKNFRFEKNFQLSMINRSEIRNENKTDFKFKVYYFVTSFTFPIKQ